MDDVKWANPKESYAIIRCTNVKYAKQLIDNGILMFNCAQAWVDMEKTKRKGQGDLFEGIFAACPP